MDIIIVLDKSGSMESMGPEPVQSINSFIKTQQDNKNCGKLSFYTFNDTVTKVYDNLDIMSITPFTTYSPYGTTALYDCIYQVVSEKMETERKTNVALIIVTDGSDNSSKKHCSKEINVLLKKQESEYKWNITYLFSNIESLQEGGKMGIRRAGMSHFDQKTPGSLNDVMHNISERLSQFNL